jgi:predicted amidophosphoribosyltransferase
MTYLVCSNCGRDVDSKKQQCPYCKANYSLVSGIELEEDIFYSSDNNDDDTEYGL